MRGSDICHLVTDHRVCPYWCILSEGLNKYFKATSTMRKALPTIPSQKCVVPIVTILVQTKTSTTACAITLLDNEPNLTHGPLN
ncbi:hypothetical protein B5X24_HaOG209862 [Helicoverpa armigera]|nr:hypothetical protein B5X24_HaOG209862 [Helicoverpa armigera]